MLPSRATQQQLMKKLLKNAVIQTLNAENTSAACSFTKYLWTYLNICLVWKQNVWLWSRPKFCLRYTASWPRSYISIRLIYSSGILCGRNALVVRGNSTEYISSIYLDLCQLFWSSRQQSKWKSGRHCDRANIWYYHTCAAHANTNYIIVRNPNNRCRQTIQHEAIIFVWCLRAKMKIKIVWTKLSEKRALNVRQ